MSRRLRPSRRWAFRGFAVAYALFIGWVVASTVSNGYAEGWVELSIFGVLTVVCLAMVEWLPRRRRVMQSVFWKRLLAGVGPPLLLSLAIAYVWDLWEIEAIELFVLGAFLGGLTLRSRRQRLTQQASDGSTSS